MENNCRILNRIVEINISNVKYADIELSGNTCFVGTNNFGKTSLFDLRNLYRRQIFFCNCLPP
jgi:hypothetical protein